MYPYHPHATQNDEDTVRGVLPEQRPPLDAALLDEPTSEVPMIRPPAGPPWGADAPSATDTPEDPERPDGRADDDPAAAAADLAGDGPVDTADADQSAGEPTVDEVDGEATAVVDPTDEEDGHDPGSEPVGEVDSTVDPAGEDGQEATGPVAATETESDVQTVTEDASPEAVAGSSRRPGEVAETPIALWSDEAADRLREQWRELQVRFIDDPAEAVTGARDLVTSAVEELADTLRSAQDALDPYRDGEPADTETMRVAMRRYREFLDRVLAL